MEVTVTKATPADMDGMDAVIHQTWLDTYPNEEYGITVADIEEFLARGQTDEARAKHRERLTEDRDDFYMLVAKNDGKVIGLAGGEKTDAYNQLKSIYVLPDYQRLGVGRALWREMTQWFDPDKKLIVHVAVYNTKAIDFYKKLGFVETGKEFTEERFTFKSGAQIVETELVIE